MPYDPREHLVRIARLVYARRLTDASGGNISLRQGDRVFITPAHAGNGQQWQIGPEDIVVVDLEGKLLEGPDRRSRESQMHLALYNAFVQQGAVIHAQGGYFMTFVAAGRPIPPVLEHTQKFGTIGVTAAAKAHSAQLARNVVDALAPQRQELETHGIATIIPRHGIVVVGRDLDDAFDTLERIETNARALLLGVLLRQLPDNQLP
jgi:L-fuculose-phosphate aldolase